MSIIVELIMQKKTIVNKGDKIWNSLDKETSNTMFYSTFKKKLKIIFLEYTYNGFHL
jgi:hypothetical protein